MVQKESTFERHLIKRIETLFPGAINLKVFPGYIQGFPDRIMLWNNTWAAYEVKRNRFANKQPNQDYYIHTLDRMSFASYVYPENEEEFFNEIQRTLGSFR